MTKIEILLLILAIFGGIEMAAKGLRIGFLAFPRLLTVQSRAWHFIADIISIPYFRRKAVVTRVEEVLNNTVYSLEHYLPKGWVKRARVEWVRRARSTQLRDGQLVLRVRPDTSPDENLMRALWVYFDSALFPGSRDLLPGSFISGAALAVTRAGLEKNHRYLLPDFDKAFVQQVTPDDSSMTEVFSDCIRLNDYGLLMGPFFREVQSAISTGRFRSDRNRLSTIIQDITKHMLDFQPFLLLRHKPEQDWRFHEGSSSYGFILVSKPPESRPAIEAYVNRAQAHVRSGVSRVYVIGRGEERDFVKMVVAALLSIRELKGEEWFSLYRDYRGDDSGVGALLSVDKLLAELDVPMRSSEHLAAAKQTIDSERLNNTNSSIQEVEEAISTDLTDIVENLIVQLSDYESDWIPLAQLGLELRKQIPGFTPQKYGFRNLFSVLRRLDLLEFEERGLGPAKSVYVRMRGHTDSGADTDNSYYSDFLHVVERVLESHVANDGWMFLGQLGQRLKSEIPGFDCVKLGSASLHDLIARVQGITIEERGEKYSKTYVRLDNRI